VDPTPVEIPPDPRADPFYAGALRRILRVLLVLGALAPLVVWWFYGFATAAGFFLGSALSWLNFKWLVRGVEGLVDRIVDAQSRERGASIVFRFLLRYILVGMVAYAIFRGSSQAFRGFLFGLGLPVAAILSEAAYEVYAALRYGY
jgi:hypothetical protein